jgi:hypothetical protein
MARTDKTVTSFPTMGTEAASLQQRHAKPERGKAVPKTGNAKGGMLEGATATHKANIAEVQGAKLAPQIAHVYPNAPEASATQKNTVIVPSALGNRDFYLRRQYGQGT